MNPGQIATDFLGHLGSLALVFLIAVGGAFAVGTALRGHASYWLGAIASVLVITGYFIAPGFLASGVTTTAVGAGIALGIFGVAIDLLLGPTAPATPADAAGGEDRLDHRFE